MNEALAWDETDRRFVEKFLGFTWYEDQDKTGICYVVAITGYGVKVKLKVYDGARHLSCSRYNVSAADDTFERAWNTLMHGMKYAMKHELSTAYMTARALGMKLDYD
jgi:hypothetical protein